MTTVYFSTAFDSDGMTTPSTVHNFDRKKFLKHGYFMVIVEEHNRPHPLTVWSGNCLAWAAERMRSVFEIAGKHISQAP